MAKQVAGRATPPGTEKQGKRIRGRLTRFGPSSMKKPKPNTRSYGITNTTRSGDPVARASKIFSNPISRNTPTGQDVLTRKVRRQAY